MAAAATAVCAMVSAAALVPIPRADAASPASPTPVSIPTITYLLPKDSAVFNPTGGDPLQFRPFTGGVPTKRELLRFNFNGDPGEVERRTDNGTIGSGKRYAVQKAVTDLGDQTKIEFTPISYTTYKQGLLLPFPVPAFSDEDLTQFLLSAEIYVKFEIDSEFNSESTYANFVRLLQVRPNSDGARDPVSGKIFKQIFVVPLRGKDATLSIETFPYRNGSKVVVHGRILATPTGPNTVDFGLLIEELRTKLKEVVAA